MFEVTTDLTLVFERLIRIAGWEVLFPTVVFAAVVAVTRVLRKAPPILLHALWGLVLVRLLLPVNLASPLSLTSLVSRLPSAAGFESAWISGWRMGIDPPIQSEPRTAASVGSARPPRESSTWIWLSVALWSCGVAAVGGRLIMRRRRYWRMVQSATTIRDPEIFVLKARWKDRFSIRRPVRLVSSSESPVPFTIGSYRPVVFVPGAVLRQKDPKLVEHVVAHELAHIKRWDDLLLEFQLLVSAVYFFHPVVWYAVRRMRAESERICDSLVLSRGGLSAVDYGRSVIAVLRLNAAGGSTPIPAFDSDKRSLRVRMESIVKTKSATARRGTVVYSLLAPIALALFLLPLASPVTPARQSQVTLDNPMPGSRVTAAWGPMMNPFTGKEAHHKGIDIVGGPGARVLAPADGLIKVATADYAGGADHGTVIILDHGSGVETFYSHLGSLAVAGGERVSRGTVLGTQGSTGKVTGPHLHFEVWVNGEPTNPGRFVADWR